MRVLRAVLWLPLLLLWRGPRAIVRALGQFGRGVGRAGRWLLRWTRPADGPEAAERRRLLGLGLVWAAAVISSLIAFGTAQFAYEINLGVAPFLGAAAGLPLALATTRPLVGWATSVGSAVVFTVLLPNVPGAPWPWGVMHGLVILALLFAVAVQEQFLRSVGAWLVTAGLFLAQLPSDTGPGWAVGVTVVAVTGLLVGRLARTSRALRRQEQVSSAEKARRVVLEERTRIARDLHDIVAHHMSLVVVQAETAPYRVPDLTDSARDELASISSVARSALAETRALLNVLRQDDQQAEHAPQPGLERLGDLVDATRRAGVTLDVDVRGPLDNVRPGTSLAAYRIIQEALANASRHAAGAPVRLAAVREAHALHLEVVNGPVPGTPTPLRPAGWPVPVGSIEAGAIGSDSIVAGSVVAGHGITGMGERVSAEGGSLQVGHTVGGGFAIRVTLPAEPTADAVPRDASPAEGAPEVLQEEVSPEVVSPGGGSPSDALPGHAGGNAAPPGAPRPPVPGPGADPAPSASAPTVPTRQAGGGMVP